MEQKELTEWRALYEIGLEIKALAPWEFTAPTDIYTIYMPDHELPIYLTPIHEGTVESFKEIAIYSTMNDINCLYKSLTNNYDVYTNVLAEKSGLSAQFSSRKEIDDANYDIIRELGYRFRGDGNWLQFISNKRGLEPWQITQQDVLFMTRCLTLFYDALNLVKTKQLTVNFANDESVTTFYDDSLKTWQHKVSLIEFPEQVDEIPQAKILNPLLFDRIKEQPRTSQIIEAGFFFLTNPLRANKTVQGGFPKLLALMDHHSQELVGYRFGTYYNDEANFVANCIANFYGQHPLPQRIMVTQHEVYHYLRDLCAEVDITLTMEKELPAVYDYFVGMKDAANMTEILNILFF